MFTHIVVYYTRGNQSKVGFSYSGTARRACGVSSARPLPRSIVQVGQLGLDLKRNKLCPVSRCTGRRATTDTAIELCSSSSTVVGRFQTDIRPTLR
ncbi:uncharacterized protein STEHIDRAFT_119627 [Stereum hirsutum FP-91666 SS1]|uniref:uncharacterized protein n=1 Tax=Stereum hirsutum (strain FP-91666) TaxID=721885 RepID=UPI000440EF4A|nr:uncharacterized protein STEHIDRAFT_119627 [Stereum hirsutum FP-91666 SS1]EIM88818.1 hypothetical protein STEHIDRAFT_119627 [Stereum hirsutum FP-91666 SS1]